jgi:single-stranded-DNA-specific exonuclease
LTEEGGILDRLVYELNSFNEERQKVQKNIFDEILENNDFDKIIAEKKIFIGKSENWNEGVLGVVASDIVKKFNIPAILFKETEGKLKGSGRSTDKFDLHGNLVLCGNLFDSFGGHRLACGISMDVSNYEDFYNSFIKIVNKNLKIQDIEKKYIYDMEINFNDITGGLAEEINLLKPFGYGNPEPSFVTCGCTVEDFSYLSEGKHVRLKLKKSGIIMDAIMFKVNESIRKKIIRNEKVSILYKIKENSWENFNTIQLVIQDLF